MQGTQAMHLIMQFNASVIRCSGQHTRWVSM